MALAFDANLGTVTGSSLTTSAAAASLSRIILFLWWFDATTTLASVSGGGLTWSVDKQFKGSVGGDQNVGIASAGAPAGLASSTAITPAFSAGAPDFGPSIAAASFTGAVTDASGFLDATSAGKDDFEETWTTNNLVTTNADDLLVAISSTDVASHTGGTAPAVEIHDWDNAGQRSATVYRIVSATGTYTIGGVWASSVSFQTNVGAAYLAAADGEPPPDPPTLMVAQARTMMVR